MADYYSECACLIEANPTQADILLEAMNELFEPDDSFIQNSFHVITQTACQKWRLLYVTVS
ncbi:hypothetical protein BANRA_05136 [Klebsiella pneumoniae]|nr:hypothetical protein BANRA_05136 [Klebsiella pneumoniae]